MSLHWTAGLAVNDGLDGQRRELLDALGAFAAARAAGADAARLLDAARARAVALFEREEAALAARESPAFLRHKAEHDRFLRDLAQLAQDHAREGAVGAGVEAWLARWVTQHFAGTDADRAAAPARRSA